MPRVQALPALCAVSSILVVVGLATVPVSAGTWLVQPDGSGDVPTIPDAIYSASPGDTILVGPGVHRYNLQKDYTYVTYAGIYLDFFTPPGLVIQSTDGAAATTIDCNDVDGTYGATRGLCLVNCDPATVIDGFTFLVTPPPGGGPGLPPGALEGAGAWINGGSPTIRNCVFEHCKGGSGGAVFIKGGSTAVIENCEFNHPYACCGLGGSMFVYDGSAPTIRNNHFNIGESLWAGGGIAFANSSGLVENNVFEGCLGTDGAGIYIQSSSVEITGNLFIGNHVTTNGAGLAITGASDGTVVVDNVFVNNTSDAHGGGIFIDGCSPVIERATILRNTALGGSGIYLQGVCAPQFSGVLVAENHGAGGVVADDPGATPVWACNNFFGNEGGEFVGTADPTGADGNRSEDPLLCDEGGTGVEACSPYLAPFEGCGMIGAQLSDGCPCSADAIPLGWGGVKALFD